MARVRVRVWHMNIRESAYAISVLHNDVLFVGASDCLFQGKS